MDHDWFISLGRREVLVLPARAEEKGKEESARVRGEKESRNRGKRHLGGP